MSFLVDLAYLLLAAISSPIWLLRMIATGKIRTNWPARFGRVRATIPPKDGRPRILLHAVSVGEVNAVREVVRILIDHPQKPHVMLASTTDTGLARAQAVFGSSCAVVRYPFDFSFAVRRFLDSVQPDVVGLVELEVWPNFTAVCARRGIRVGVINGRLSERSARRYARIAGLVRPAFRRLSFAAAQTETYAARFRSVGVAEDRVIVTDTMKWDTAVIEDDVTGGDELADAMGIDRSRPLIVAGSTAREEHAFLHQCVPDQVQLLCAPRKPEWFDQAAADLPGCARRSKGDSGSKTNRFLLDTIGELRPAYSIADIVIVGRTFAPYGGSDMMEPISLGKATIIGPDVTNFRDTARVLLERDGLIQTNRESLPNVIQELLDQPRRRDELARNGRDVIREHQGASARHAELLMKLICAEGHSRDTR